MTMTYNLPTASAIFACHPDHKLYYQLKTGPDFNRKTSPAHVARLKRAIEESDCLSINPIIVTKDLSIIDGQHRYQAATELRRTFYLWFIETYDAPRVMVAKNSEIKSWTLLDYAKYFANVGNNPLYQKFLEKLKSYPLTSPGVMLAIFTGQINVKQGTTPFKQGKLSESVISDRQIEKTLVDLYKFHNSYVLPESIFRRSDFQQAVLAIRLGNPQDLPKLLKKLPRTEHSLASKGRFLDIIRECSDIIHS